MTVKTFILTLGLFGMALMVGTSVNAANAEDSELLTKLSDLKNVQVNTPLLISSGLPNEDHFKVLATYGVTHVIDLIPGDRSAEIKLLKSTSLNYHNIAVDWNNPKLEHFKDYVVAMEQGMNKGKVLTHCKLNWRGAVFTYLYRVIKLQEDETIAKQDMLAIWQPNEVWQNFITQVKAHYL